MKTFKRLAVLILTAVVALSCTVIGASAVTDEQRKEITDELFEIVWYRGMYADYWQLTRSTVPIKDNPRAATAYMTIKAEVDLAENSILEQLINGEIDIQSFYEDNEFDLKKAKSLPLYKNTLIEGYEFSYVDYQNGVFEMKLDETYQSFYGYFREDENNFTLYDNDTNEVLGVYPRLLDFDYLDEAGNGTGGSGNGGNGGNNGSGGTSSENSEPENVIPSNPTPPSTGIPNTSTRNTGKTDSDHNHAEYPDTDNPAVTPEIVSMVDAMKSSDEEFDKPVSQSPPKSSNNHTLIIILAVVAVICVAAFVLKKKTGKSGK